MATAKKGDRVKIHYKGSFADGIVFDTSEGKEPLEFTLGEGKVIPGFEKNIDGMEQGEKKTFQVGPTEGYGESRKELIQEIPRNKFPKNVEAKKGQVLVLKSPDGKQIMTTITQADAEKVTLDLNHPLAGKTLTFEVEVVEVL